MGFVNGCWVIGWGFVAKVAFFLALRPDAMSDGAGIGDSRVFYTSWKQDYTTYGGLIVYKLYFTI